MSLATSLLAACSDEPPTEELASGGTSGAAATGGSSGAATGGTGATGGSGATGGGATGGSAGTSSGGTAGTGGGATGGSAGMSSGGTAGTGVTGDRGTPEGTCARWNADRADLSEGTWSGSVASCTVGDISPEGRANALKLVNLYRWLADLPAVATEAGRDAEAQACALMMEAGDTLSHEPGMDWECYSEAGADGAGSSNISSGPGVASIDGYMLDPGNATTLGHRRWTLSNSLGPIGLGSTATGASCFQNLSGTGRAGKPWMAWPAPGIIPLRAFGGGRQSIDDTGWSIQSDGINLAGAVVTVTAGGTAMPVTVTQLQGGYGSRYAIRFNPMGWDTAAGQTYAVSVTGISTPIEYQVEVVDCAM